MYGFITPAGSFRAAANPMPDGYKSCDFPGEPSPRYGSFVDSPAYHFPWPQAGAGWLPNFFLPVDAGLLRLPQLVVSMPNLFAPSVTAGAAHPTIRKQIFPALPPGS